MLFRVGKSDRMLIYNLLEPIPAAPKPTYQVYRIGGIVLGQHRKIVYYQLQSDGTENQPLRLERAGDYPTLTSDDEIFAAIMNIQRGRKPEQFVLTFDVETGATPNPTPVRPTFDRPSAASTESPPPTAVETGAYEDVILPFGKRFAGNDIVKVTISTYYPAVTSNTKTVTTGGDAGTSTEIKTETAPLKLLDKVEYPQIHALYSYNIATGVVASRLRNPTFTKYIAKCESDDTCDKPVYDIQAERGVFETKAILAFSFYWGKKDIQEKLSGKDLVPVPTLGFALTNPAENFFFGFSSEFPRNVQWVYGYHYGKVRTRGLIQANDNRSGADPLVGSRFRGNVFVGVTFNINFIKELFAP